MCTVALTTVCCALRMVTIAVMVLFVVYLEPAHDVDTSADVDSVFQQFTGGNDLVDEPDELGTSLLMLEQKGVIPIGTSWDKVYPTVCVSQ